MAVTSDKTANGFVQLTVDGVQHLGVKISGHKRSMAGQLQSLRRGHGWVIAGDRVQTWEIEGLIEHEGAIYAYGAHRPNRTLAEIVASEGERSIAQLRDLVSALAALERKSLDSGRYQPNLILAFSDGGMLFLPRNIVEGVLSAQTERERVDAYDGFNHPDLEGERNACFFVGALAYQALTGSLPYTADTVEEIHQRIRQQRVLPPQLSRPEIRGDLSDLIVRSLDAEQEVTLAEWQETLAQCVREGVEREVGKEERSRLSEEAQRFARSAESGYRRRNYFRRNWRTMAIAAGIIVIVGAVGASILKNALKPRITVGMPPQQVVQLFYTSMNSFNSQAMQDCVIDGAGKAAINEATNLYVISRVRQGYEGTTGYVSAQKWLDEGKPKLRPGVSVYGVADLSVKQDSPGSYTVSYQKWEPVQASGNQPPSNTNGPVIMKVQGWKQVDRVHVRNEGKFWAIDRIDHITRSKIGGPVTVTNPNEPAHAPLNQYGQPGATGTKAPTGATPSASGL